MSGRAAGGISRSADRCDNSLICNLLIEQAFNLPKQARDKRDMETEGKGALFRTALRDGPEERCEMGTPAVRHHADELPLTALPSTCSTQKTRNQMRTKTLPRQAPDCLLSNLMPALSLSPAGGRCPHEARGPRARCRPCRDYTCRPALVRMASFMQQSMHLNGRPFHEQNWDDDVAKIS